MVSMSKSHVQARRDGWTEMTPEGHIFFDDAMSGLLTRHT